MDKGHSYTKKKSPNQCLSFLFSTTKTEENLSKSGTNSDNIEFSYVTNIDDYMNEFR